MARTTFWLACVVAIVVLARAVSVAQVHDRAVAAVYAADGGLAATGTRSRHL